MNCCLWNILIFPDLPMPVRKETISKAIENSEYEPRKGGERKRCEIPLARSFRNPAKKVEDYECDMKHKEECIRDLICAIIHLVCISSYSKI